MGAGTRYSLLLFAMVALPQGAVAACLLNDYSVRGEYDRSVAVVTGQVVAEHAVAESEHHLDGVAYTVMIEAVYRGDLRGSVEVFSENSRGQFPMQRQGRYALFIYRGAGRCLVDNCGHSGPAVEKAAVVREVEKIVRPRRGGQKRNSALHPDAACGRTGERGRSMP